MTRVLILMALLAFLAGACATDTPEPAPAAPAPVAQPEPEPEPEPPVLPKTASPLPAVGLVGLISLGLAGGVHALRRRKK